MNVAQEGNTVKVGYTAKLPTGVVFETSRTRGPVQFRIGSGKMFPALEKAVVGMSIGDTKTITVPEEQAFGPKRTELMLNVTKDSFKDSAPEVGKKYKVNMPDGRSLEAVVLWVDEDKVTLDANHPLAGNALTFDIELLEIG